MQVPVQEPINFLSECTRKIHMFLNDKRITRERAKREGRAAKSRQWFPESDMWLRGTAALDTAAPVQEREVKKEVRFVAPDRLPDLHSWLVQIVAVLCWCRSRRLRRCL